MRLSDNEKRDAIKLLQEGKPLPDKYRFLLFQDDREYVIASERRERSNPVEIASSLRSSNDEFNRLPPFTDRLRLFPLFSLTYISFSDNIITQSDN